MARREESQVFARARHQRAYLAAFAAAGMVLASDTASAQGLFDFLFGRGSRQSAPPGPPVQAYAPPSRSHDGLRSSGTGAGQYTAYCVRLCDGRYFPIQREAGNPAQLCASFCPAAQTKIFSGSGIDYATAQDGQRYQKLKNAFAYREQTVPDCTCNGKNPFGIARLDPKDDPTLRPGDVVATKDGLLAYSGSSRSNSAEFTPIQSYSGMSKEMRKSLAALKILPTAERTGPQTTSTVGQGSRDSPRRSQTSR
jgi:hypothetical protein